MHAELVTELVFADAVAEIVAINVARGENVLDADRVGGCVGEWVGKLDLELEAEIVEVRVMTGLLEPTDPVLLRVGPRLLVGVPDVVDVTDPRKLLDDVAVTVEVFELRIVEVVVLVTKELAEDVVLDDLVLDDRIVTVIVLLAVVVLVLEILPVLVREIRADRLSTDALTLVLAVGVAELRILRVGVGEPVLVFDLRALIVKLGVAVSVFVWSEEADVVFVRVIVRVDEDDAVIVLERIPE